MSQATPPLFPYGEFQGPDGFDRNVVEAASRELATTPGLLRELVGGFESWQLETVYRNWTIRQIVFHIADSHLHSLIRCKWALTEDRPTIKPYAEGRWAELADAKNGELEIALDQIEATHARLVSLIGSLTDEECCRTYFHPEEQQEVPLWKTFSLYAWHGHHHMAQIEWICKQQGWETGKR